MRSTILYNFFILACKSANFDILLWLRKSYNNKHVIKIINWKIILMLKLKRTY